MGWQQSKKHASQKVADGLAKVRSAPESCQDGLYRTRLWQQGLCKMQLLLLVKNLIFKKYNNLKTVRSAPECEAFVISYAHLFETG